jgi:hypothetical protein
MTEGAQVDVVEDLSAYVISGAASAVQYDADYESTDAPRLLHDGDLVRVDGSAGTVQLVKRAEK